MSIRYDEISLEYWKNNRKKVGSSKSYSCYHNGYVYGDEMKCTGIEFVYLDSKGETVYKGSNDSLKDAYFKLVEKACTISASTTNNFLSNSAEKFRIYTREQVDSFSVQQKNSTRIKDESSKITVGGIEYYVANNLKVCEYFNSASMNIDSVELEKWFIRIYFDDDNIKLMVDSDENEAVVSERTEFVLTVNPNPTNSMAYDYKKKATATVKVDFNKLNAAKKKTGDLGESIVLNYEIQRLKAAGKHDLAAKVEHTSLVRGDGFGYDIISYTDDGKELFIEVKTTKQNRATDFYMSRKEKEVANKMHSEGKQYRVYRVYKLNDHNGTGELAIYSPPFDDSVYDMQPENWRIRVK